jgi:hypothetical protein
MANLLNPIYLDDALAPDPIISADESELFQSLHIQMCAETGADPAYISVRRVVDWLSARRAKAANA